MSRGLLVRFVVSAVIGALVAVSVGAVTAGPRIASTARSDQPVSLTGGGGPPLEFGLVPGDPKPIAPLPPTATIQLTTFKAAVASSAPPGGEVPTPWWQSSVPRIPAITQFDGGPLQAVNCTMAAGAMLARLGYGVVATGSQLRALQDDKEGGTNFGDLEAAVGRGWGIRFSNGALTPLQLRAVLYAGAGAVIAGRYGELPERLRLQRDFTAGHAIYLDAFRPPDANGPAAYYVMDPIGRTWEGYQGAWWPADDVERFATKFGRGRIYTSWTFPGGVVPAHHPILPPAAYPSDVPPPDGGPDASQPPDPMPSGSLPPTAEPPGEAPPGEVPPREVPHFPDFDFGADVSKVIDPGVAACLARPQPADCPRGIRGLVDLRGVKTATGTAPPDRGVHVLYADPIAPGVYQLIIEAPPDTSSELWFWTKAGDLQAAKIDEAVLDGKPVSVATVAVDPAADFSFLATAAGDGTRAVGSVGTLDVRS